jgi:nucleoside-diphosphate-sugar epimerase
MKVLILGASGYLGPHLVRALAPHHRLRITDIQPPTTETVHDFMRVDVASLEQVMQAAKGMDAIVNLSVVRESNQLAFDVNTRGCYNVMRAAVEHGIRRIINTGPHFTVTGPTYEGFDYAISPDVPPHSGTYLYALTKSLGQEICRVFTENYDVYVQDFLFYNFRDHGVPPSYYSYLRPGSDPVPFVVSGADAAEAFRLGLEIDLARLPSRCEVFFIFTDMPHGKFLNDKAKRLLGFAPKEDISQLWRKAN